MYTSEIAFRLDPNAKRVSDTEYFCKSPIRSEKKASIHLTFDAKEQKTLGFDFGDKESGFTRALEAVGLEDRDLYVNPYPPARAKAKPNWQRYVEAKYGELIARYDYHDIKDQYTKTKLRFQNKDFHWGYFKAPNWFEFLNGQKFATSVFGSSVADVTKAIADGKSVFLTEGEKDCDSLTKRGLVAISAGSCGSWTKDHGEFLRGADVVICGDYDEAGRKLVAKIQRDLKGVAKSVVAVFPFAAVTGGDVTNFFEAGGTVEGLMRMAYPHVLDSFAPRDRTDLGQAVVLRKMVGDELLYSLATGFLVYDGRRFQADDLAAQRLSQELTERQLEEAKVHYNKASDELTKAADNPEALAKAKVKAAKALQYFDWVLSRRRSGAIQATLKEIAPMVSVQIDDLDKDEYLLNCPDCTVDLRTGKVKVHDPRDCITKMTAASPSTDGMEEWQNYLDKLTCGDADLKLYLQKIAGMIAIGHVYTETLVIAYGVGGNGKSTFFNALARVLGDYAGYISADVLTADTRKNKDPEIAELMGKRLVVAGELEEGSRMSVSTVKRICSTDKIKTQKKFKAPFEFWPSHTTILYTNYLPKVGSGDDGTWDRVIVLPFNAKFRGQKGEIKDYASFLVECSGGAILSWIVEGAQMFIKDNHTLTAPKCVVEATSEYQQENDWLKAFVDSCCDVGSGYVQPSGELYARYKAFCEDNNEYCRSSKDFSKALARAGYGSKRGSSGIRILGLRLKEKVDVNSPTASSARSSSGDPRPWEREERYA